MTPLDKRELLAPVSYERGTELPSNQWDQLEEGHYVIVQRGASAISVGEVEERTRDASVFWVWLDGGRGRIAVYDDEATCVWLPKGYRL